jgi:hypothetical protein
MALGNGTGIFTYSGTRNLIGTNGDGVADTAERNVISGNNSYGISFFGAINCVIAGNFIGTDATGTVAVGNGSPGIVLQAPTRSTLIGTNGDGVADEAERNVISGSVGGVWIAGADDNVVAGNYIGTDVTGNVAMPNVGGILISEPSQGNRIGTDGNGVADAAERNIIAGVTLSGPGVTDNVIAGNFIGTDVTGSLALGNGTGIVIESGAHDNRIGTNGDGVADAAERNVISGNQDDGVYITGLGTDRNVVAGNFIGTDVTGTRPLGNLFGIEITDRAHDNRVGTNGDGVADASERNIIAASADYGIYLLDPVGDGSGADGTVVAGNYIGTDVTGTVALGNAQVGIYVYGSSSCRIGTDSNGLADAAESNLISGNPAVGLLLAGNGNLVAGNFIGTDATGLNALGNGKGVLVVGSNNVIGDVAPGMGNRIAYNAGYGVGVRDATSNGNRIRGNSIDANGGLGIDLGLDGITLNDPGDADTGPNGLQNFPVLATAYGGLATAISGMLGSTPSTTFTLDFYANDPDKGGAGFYGQGQYYLGSATVTTDCSGNATFNVASLETTTPGEWISATATDPTGNTSEFFQDVKVFYYDVTTLTSSANPSVYGQAVTFTATVAAINSAYGTPTGSVQFVVDGTNFGTSVTLVNGSATSAAIASLGTANHTVTAVYSGDTEFVASISAAMTQVVNQDSTTTAVIASPPFANVGQIVTFTSTVAANAPGSGTPTGTVDFFDITTNTDLTPSGVSLSSGTAAFSTTSLAIGNHTIKATYSGDINFLTSNASTGTITIGQSIIVLDPSAGGALTLSGNASINLAGAVFVDSSSSSALSASGNAQINASTIKLHGGVQKSGSASVSPIPVTGAAVLADPLGSLAPPSTTGMTNYGSESLSGNSSATINPGIYSRITVSGNATLTMNTGTYIIEGGGFTVSGNASASCAHVFIYNAGSNYPSSGGNFGGITLSGNGTFSLTAQTSGTYAGVLIFQSRQNTRALSLSGNATAGLTGTIYAANALVSLSGNAQLQSSLDVGTLSLSGNVALTQTAAGSDGTGDTSGIANTLLAGDLSVYINDPNGYFTSDELARIQDAINAWNAILAPYNVTITEVTDPTLANMVIDTGTTSACGGMSDGVLGCFNAPNSEITLIQGWNWYAGSDPTQISTSQYDFETTVLHELGHALGLGGSTNSSSPMYETLASGVADRTVTTQDLNIPDPPTGADPQMVAGFHLNSAPPAPAQTAYAAFGSGLNSSAVGAVPLSPAGVTATSSSTALLVQSNLLQQPAESMVQQAIIAQAGPEGSLVPQATDRENQHCLIPWLTPAATDQTPALDAIQQPATSTAEPAIHSQAGHEPSVVPQPTNQVLDLVLDELAADSVLWREENAVRTTGVPALPVLGLPGKPVPIDLMRQQDRPGPPGSFTARLAVILLAAGSCGYGLGILGDRNRQAGRLNHKRKSTFLADLRATKCHRDS